MILKWRLISSRVRDLFRHQFLPWHQSRVVRRDHLHDSIIRHLIAAVVSFFVDVRLCVWLRRDRVNGYGAAGHQCITYAAFKCSPSIRCVAANSGLSPCYVHIRSLRQSVDPNNPNNMAHCSAYLARLPQIERGDPLLLPDLDHGVRVLPGARVEPLGAHACLSGNVGWTGK